MKSVKLLSRVLAVLALLAAYSASAAIEVRAENTNAFMLSSEYERCAQQEPFCCSGLQADAYIVCEDACYPYFGEPVNESCSEYVGDDEDMCCLTFDCWCYPPK